MSIHWRHRSKNAPVNLARLRVTKVRRFQEPRTADFGKSRHALELGRFSTRNNFHSEVLRRSEVFVLTYVDRIILPSENSSTSAK
jgi:hypothetical protein